MHRLPKALLAIAAAVLLSPSSHAVPRISGAAEFNNVQYGVLDLTPNDSVASYYQFGPLSAVIDASISAEGGAIADGRTFYPTFPVPVAAEGHLFDSDVSASTNGQMGDLHSAADMGSLPYSGDYVNASAGHGVRILLSAHSAFTVSGLASAWVSMADPSYAGLSGYADVRVGLSYVSVDQPDLFIWHHLSLSDGQLYDSVSDTFSLTARNDFDHAIELQLNFNVQTRFEQTVMPVPEVPEPTTYLMFGAGLAVLASAARRGQRSSTAA